MPLSPVFKGELEREPQTKALSLAAQPASRQIKRSPLLQLPLTEKLFI